MRNRAAIEKSIDLLRAAGDDASADDLVAELAEADEAHDSPAVIVDVDVDGADGPATESDRLASVDSVADAIEAQTAHDVAVIEAQTAAAIELADADVERAELIEEARTDGFIEGTEAVVEALAAAEPDPDPSPRTGHWFYRPMGRKSRN